MAESNAIDALGNNRGLGLWAKVKVVGRTARMFWRFTFDKPSYTRPTGTIPVERMTRAGLLAAEDRTLWKLGHSSVLMKLEGSFFLTDPVFGKRASPIFFAGPKRFHPTPISIKELPPVKAVILSHDHYDHLDKKAVQKLAKKTEVFIAPKGVGDHLRRWGIAAEKIREFEWGGEVEVGGVKLTCTPTQHFSGRSLFNRNASVWCSWVIEDGGFRVFYGADSGYFEGFKAIGDKYGPFDVTMVENGAYNVGWPLIHMQPEETVQAHLDSARQVAGADSSWDFRPGDASLDGADGAGAGDCGADRGVGVYAQVWRAGEDGCDDAGRAVVDAGGWAGGECRG